MRDLYILMILYPEKFDEEMVISHVLNPNLTWELVEDIPGINWNKSLFSPHNPANTKEITKDILNNNNITLLSFNKNITWELITSNLDLNWDWEKLSHNSAITWDIVKSNVYPWNFRYLVQNSSMTWNIIQTDILHKIGSTVWFWKHLTRNPNITWDIIDCYLDKPWDWNVLSRRRGINIDIFIKYMDKWNFRALSISMILTLEIVNLSSKWVWQDLSINKSLYWKIVSNYLDKNWDWTLISSRLNLTWNIIQANPNLPWDWKLISAKKCITWDIIKTNPKLNTEYIFRNPNITWEIIQSNPELANNISWRSLSANPNLTWKIVKDNIEKPWDWLLIYKNQYRKRPAVRKRIIYKIYFDKWLKLYIENRNYKQFWKNRMGASLDIIKLRYLDITERKKENITPKLVY